MFGGIWVEQLDYYRRADIASLSDQTRIGSRLTQIAFESHAHFVHPEAEKRCNGAAEQGQRDEHVPAGPAEFLEQVMGSADVDPVECDETRADHSRTEPGGTW